MHTPLPQKDADCAHCYERDVALARHGMGTSRATRGCVGPRSGRAMHADLAACSQAQQGCMLSIPAWLMPGGTIKRPASAPNTHGLCMGRQADLFLVAQVQKQRRADLGGEVVIGGHPHLDEQVGLHLLLALPLFLGPVLRQPLPHMLCYVCLLHLCIGRSTAELSASVLDGRALEGQRPHTHLLSELPRLTIYVPPGISVPLPTGGRGGLTPMHAALLVSAVVKLLRCTYPTALARLVTGTTVQLDLQACQHDLCRAETLHLEPHLAHDLVPL